MGKIFDHEKSLMEWGDLTLFEALAGGVFDHLNCQHTREFDQNLQKKSQIPRGLRGGIGSFVID